MRRDGKVQNIKVSKEEVWPGIASESKDVKTRPRCVLPGIFLIF